MSRNTKTQRMALDAESDPAEETALQEAVEKLEAVWRSVDTVQAKVKVTKNHQGVDGLMVCQEFLSIEEVQKLREVFKAHSIWTR